MAALPGSFQPSGFQQGEFQPLQAAGIGGIASAEAVGAPALRLVDQPVAIPSAEAFGAAKVTRSDRAAGIPSAAAVAEPRVTRDIGFPAGITSAEAFGTARVAGPTFVTGVGAIGSGEAFGTATLTGVAVVTPPPTGGGFGYYWPAQPPAERLPPRQTPARQVVAVEGIATAENVGRPSVAHDLAAPDTLRALRRLALRKRVPVPGVDSVEQIGAPVVRQLLPLATPAHAARLDGPLPRPGPGGTFTAQGGLATIQLPPPPSPVVRDSDDEELLLLLDLV